MRLVSISICIEGTFTRVMAGDQSLIEVINANAASQGPVQSVGGELNVTRFVQELSGCDVDDSGKGLDTHLRVMAQ